MRATTIAAGFMYCGYPEALAKTNMSSATTRIAIPESSDGADPAGLTGTGLRTGSVVAAPQR